MNMTKVFLSYSTKDTRRIELFRNELFGGSIKKEDVFWAHDIPIGTPNYQGVIVRALQQADVVLGFLTLNSVASSPVVQECVQAQKDRKLIQVVLDDIPPILLPMDLDFRAQKMMMVGWAGIDWRDKEKVHIFRDDVWLFALKRMLS
jgi:TIR domain